jgi:hypothetical protein
MNGRTLLLDRCQLRQICFLVGGELDALGFAMQLWLGSFGWVLQTASAGASKSLPGRQTSSTASLGETRLQELT